MHVTDISLVHECLHTHMVKVRDREDRATAADVGRG